MIAQLTGRLQAAGEPGRGIVDVQGVGYEVFAPTRTLQAISGDEPGSVHVSTQVREDAITLFAFETTLERTAFHVLLGVTGVGPRMALSALDVLSVGELHRAVETDDVLTLSRIPGVGKKKAQRLALELKGKLPAGTADFEVKGGRPRPRPGPTDDLPLALAQLDYGKTEIDRALAALEEQGIGPDAPPSDRLRAALAALAGSAR